MKGKLVLEDGSIYYGQLISDIETVGEVVFNTGMTGYQEVLTDPSYCGQIVTMTYPLIGNYGINAIFEQSRQPYVKGFIISELCEDPSNCLNEMTLTDYLIKNKIPCIYGVDTRSITRRIRSYGTMKGIIIHADASDQEVAALMSVAPETNVVEQVTTKEVYHITNEGPRVVVMDFGIKQNILHFLHKIGCNLTVVPASTTAAEVLSYNPAGIFLSNGPGDPKDVPEIIAEVKKLIGAKPIFGICLGHQLLALALGADTYKLKFGHRGSNQPVKNLITGRVHISSQNHGYAVDEASLSGKDLVVTHRAVNDGTIEGMRHTSLPIFSVQYHPEAGPGPDDNIYLFDEFMTLLNGGK